MKRVKEVILLIGVFIISIVLILLYFIGRYRYNNIIEKAREISNFVSTLESGIYEYKRGVLYNMNGNIINSSLYFNAEGKIGKNDYGHIIINFKNEDKYICKTALGKIKYGKKCEGDNLKVEMSRNNYQISFDLDENINSYKISQKNDFSGDFKDLSLQKDEKFIINLDNVGTYYIWFKDKYGNISDVIEYSAECLNVIEEEFSNKILYCAGSVVKINDESFIVIKDEVGEVDLMSYNTLNDKLSHCMIEESDFCYYVSDENMREYSWGSSNINDYLNNTYYSNLSDELKNMIVEKEICNNKSGHGGCDSNDGCGGYKKSVIDANNWVCDNYVKSKVRLISYDEYSYLLNNSKNKIIFNDYFHLINSSNESMKSLSVLTNGDVYTKEKTIEKLSIRPVITIKK